ncbi:hypothetical protein T492DRAFT_909968 [Pavlovales sp. CCMP2436]|nr:hypothetical protein T492DRAFT_909968 [Pavlovales sp. CCMP2436]
MVSFAKVGAWTSARTGADERSGGVERERARVASSAATNTITMARAREESHIRARLDYAHRAGKQFRWRVQLPLAATGIIGLLIAIVVGVFSVVYNGPILLSIALIMVGPSFLFLALSLTPVETYLVKLGISLCIVVEIFFAAIMQPLAAQMAPRRGLARAMVEASSSGQHPRRASTRLLARAESALPPMLRALGGDLLHAIFKVLDDADLPCVRLACKAFRDHSSPAQEKCRVAFLRTHALVVFAFERMPGFVPEATPPGAESDDDDDLEDDEPIPLLSLAASIGIVGVLAELVDNRQCELTADACAAAAGRGNLDALVWLRNRGCPWDKLTSQLAAFEGHLQVLRYAHEHGCPWDSWTCQHAAQGGHLEVLRYAHEHGCPLDRGTCQPAASGGHLEVLQYAHEHGCEWGIAICYRADSGGHLEVLRYVHEHGCPWDSTTCYRAASRGHLEVLRYAHEHSCPWDSDTCYYAAEGGHLEVLRYAHEHGCP